MSSIFSPRPALRLMFGDGAVTLLAKDRDAPIGRAICGRPEFASELRALGAEVRRTGARLTVVLPPDEVWRGGLALRARGSAGRRAEAQAAVGALLSLRPADLVAILGPRTPDGAVAVAAVRRETLNETRRFLRQAGLRRAAIVGAGAFPGFPAPPRLDPLLGFSGLDGRKLMSFRRGGAVSGPRAWAAVGVAGALAILIAVSLANPDAPSAPDAPAAQFAAAPLAPPPVVVASVADLPVIRPRPAPAIRPVPMRAEAARPAAPAALDVPADEAARPLLTMATRDFPAAITANDFSGISAVRGESALQDAPRNAELTPAPVRASGAAVPAPPRRRPAAAGATATPSSGLRPASRPKRGGAEAVRPPAVAAVAPPSVTLPPTDAAPRIRPIPRRGMPIASAAAPAIAGSDAAPPPIPSLRTAALLPGPDLAAPAPPLPRRLAAPAKPAAAPVALTPQIARLAPAPQAPRAAAPQRAPVVATPQPARSATTSAQQPAAAARGSVSLIGVFGASGRRHALVQLADGTVQRVRPGDIVQGGQVAAVGPDSLRLRAGGRETLLKLPD